MPGNPIVIAHHLMWTLYGWWLPNDPRGSTSTTIKSDILSELGELHLGRKKIQPAGHELREFYDNARSRLMQPLLSFAPGQFAPVAAAIGTAVEECGYTCWSMAVMPDHVHILIRKHRDQAEEMIEKIQVRSRRLLIEGGLREEVHPVWSKGGWKVFLDHPDEVRRTARYIEQNPVRRAWPVQHWAWVKAYDNWPLHVGHSERSPYVIALKAAGRYP